jgi:predicted outer membrane repeat protein
MRKITLLYLLVSLSFFANAAVYYVSPAGNGSTGTSWFSAFTSVRAALDVATVGDELWVAQGTYTIANQESQLIFKNGVNVYGGFAGTESTRAARNSNPELTIIKHQSTVETNFRLLMSTNLDDAALYDGFTFDGNNVGLGVHLSGNCTLNNAIVKNCSALNGSGVGVYIAGNELTPVVLSNATVTSNRLRVNNVNTFPLGGAGVFVSNGSKLAELKNCTVEANTIEGISATGTHEAMGAGIYIVEGKILNSIINNNKLENSANATYSHNNFTAGGIAIVPMGVAVPAKSVLIEGCKITNNVSPSRGGGIIIDPRWSGQYHGNYTIRKSIVTNNKSGAVGGGLLATAATRQTGDGWTLNIENSLFTNNSAGTNSAGGGLFINASQILNITNATFANNLAPNYGGGGIYMQSTANQTIKASLKNVLLWGNESPNRATHEKQIGNGSQLSTIIFSAIQSFDPTATHLATATQGDNVVLNASNTHASGPGFVAPSALPGYGVEGALTANWKLQSSSILIDAGDDYLTEDLEGTSRPQGDYSDIGAYEYSVNTAVNEVQHASLRLYSSAGSIVFDNDSDARKMDVFTAAGTKVASVQLSSGLNSVRVIPGHLYIVRIDTKSAKVLVQ